MIPNIGRPNFRRQRQQRKPARDSHIDNYK
jgi:hypothetical protein